MPFFCIIVKHKIKPFAHKKSAKIKILALNAHRYQADLEILNSHEDLVIYTLPPSVQTLLNALFYRHLPKQIEGKGNVEKFSLFADIADGEERAGLVRYLEHFLPPLLRSLKIDALMSCSFFYMADIDWQRACVKSDIPFFALHKENMQDNVVREQMISRYSSMKLKYYGHRLFLYNHLVKKVIVGADVCDPDVITVTGAARMDSLFKKIKDGNIAKPGRQVTLFSSHHCIGLLSVPSAINYFSQNPDEGFVEYFDLVHGHIIKFASENPDVKVFIKPKWGDSWIDYILLAGKKMGYEASEISNLHIDWQIPAQELIENSGVIIGINSTTLLEALIVGRPVVVPLFAEAAGEYYDKHIYFKEYEEAAFNIVKNPSDLGSVILDELNGKVKKREIPDQMIKDYLGYCDDRSTQRIADQIKRDIISIKG